MTDIASRVERVRTSIADIPQIKRGQVWCRACGFTRKTDGMKAITSGWPKHCGYTMTLDSPEEQAALAAARATHGKEGA